MLQIPMSGPDITTTEIEAINEVLSASHLSMGPFTKKFERLMTEFTDTSHAATVSSGTSGLHLCMIAANVTDGDLVITSPFSFIASANAILYERGIPIFVDVEESTGNIDPIRIASVVEDITKGRSSISSWLPRNLRSNFSLRGHLKAILPVHAFGQPADMDPIQSLSRQHNLALIEDSCEAIGAEYKGRKAGSLGDAAVFAFYPNKQMTTGEGGMIVTQREDWSLLFCSLRNQGRDDGDTWLNHPRLGYNYRLDEMSAAIGWAQLTRIEELLKKRATVAGWYNERLSEVDGIRTPFITPSTTRMSWFVYVIRIDPQINRTAVMIALQERGIPTRAYFNPIHLQPFYRQRFGYRNGDFPITETLGNSCLALPFSGTMTEDQVDHVSKNLVTILKRAV